MRNTGVQFVQKSGSHLKITGAKFQVEDLHILGPIVQNLVPLGS